MNGCFVDMTVVPAIRSKYLWRGSGPGVAMAMRTSIRKITQKILLKLRVITLLDGALPPSSIWTFKPITLLPNVAADVDDSKTTE